MMTSQSRGEVSDEWHTNAVVSQPMQITVHDGPVSPVVLVYRELLTIKASCRIRTRERLLSRVVNSMPFARRI